MNKILVCCVVLVVVCVASLVVGYSMGRSDGILVDSRNATIAYRDLGVEQQNAKVNSASVETLERELKACQVGKREDATKADELEKQLIDAQVENATFAIQMEYAISAAQSVSDCACVNKPICGIVKDSMRP